MSSTLHQSLHHYAALTKPQILPMVIFTGLPPIVMTAQEVSPLWAAVTLIGIALAGAAANTLNCYVERDRDALMERTRSRPLPAAQITSRSALAFGLGLAASATRVFCWLQLSSFGNRPTSGQSLSTDAMITRPLEFPCHQT